MSKDGVPKHSELEPDPVLRQMVRLREVAGSAAWISSRDSSVFLQLGRSLDIGPAVRAKTAAELLARL
jgi:hypothetical protein